MVYINKLFNLKDKVVTITGGAGYLCSEMARGFNRAGCLVVLMDIDEEGTERIAREIKQDGGQALALANDVTKKESFEHCLAIALEEFGKVDIMVNGAGINAPTSFLKISEKEWDRILAVQLKGTLFGCQVFGKQMLEQGSGSIINISSASAGPPLSKAFAYSAAKAGIRNLTMNLGREWAAQGVRVNALRPGFFPTEWNRQNFITPERERAILGHTPMARFGEPSELVGAVIWLASDASSYATGTNLLVEGGWTAW